MFNVNVALEEGLYVLETKKIVDCYATTNFSIFLRKDEHLFFETTNSPFVKQNAKDKMSINSYLPEISTSKNSFRRHYYCYIEV